MNDRQENDQPLGHPTHKSVSDAGYRPIPIIPPTVPLSANTTIRLEDRGKIPGRMNSDLTWSGYDWLNTKSNDRALDRWTNSGAGVGVVCGEPSGVIGLDIDCLDQEAADIARQVAEARLGVAPIRIGRAPKCMLVFRIDAFSDLIKWRKIGFKLREDQDEQLVEIRGAGQQFVAYGIHPKTQQPYTWTTADGVMPPLSRLPIVDEEDVIDYFELLAARVEELGGEMVRKSAGATGSADREKIGQDGLAYDADRLDELVEAVSMIPNNSDLFPARDDYIKVGCAIKAAFAADEQQGFVVWLDWAYRWEDGTHSEQEPERDWKRMKAPFEVGSPYLVELARSHGWKDAKLKFEALPDNGEDEQVGKTERSDDGITGASETAGVEFWDRYVWVEDIERFVDLEERSLLTMRQFSVRFPHIGKGPFSQTESPAAIYLTNSAMRSMFHTRTYRPGQGLDLLEGRQRAVNTWSPGPVHSQLPGYGWAHLYKYKDIPCGDKDINKFMGLAEHLFPDDRERGLLLDWMAFQIQHPGVKCGWHPVIGGAQGIGKDSLLQPLIMGLGEKNVSQTSPADLSGAWTHWALESQLVIVQEMNNFHRREVMDKLKPYLAAPPDKIQINIKGVPQYSQPNIMNMVFFTNHADAVALEQGDRRCFVLWSEAKPLTAVWFREYYQWLYEHKGAAAVCGWLAQRDLSAFDGTGRAPETIAKDKMRIAALSPVEACIYEAITEGEDIFAHRDLLTIREIADWLRHGRGFGPKDVTPHRVGKALREMNDTANLGRTLMPDGSRGRVWAVRRAATYEDHSVPKIAAVYESQLTGEVEKRLAKKFNNVIKLNKDDKKDGD